MSITDVSDRDAVMASPYLEIALLNSITTSRSNPILQPLIISRFCLTPFKRHSCA